jgi:hypothetical protein
VNSPPSASRNLEALQPLQRRTLIVLVAAQAFGGAGLAAGLAVGALLARDLLGGEALSGLPSALQVIGSAAAAVPLSRLMSRLGRRPGLVAGYLLGGAGAAVAVAAAEFRSFPLLLVGSVLFGVGNASGLLSRYAAADLALPSGRARAISTVLLATTLGAVAGPNLVDPTGGVARALDLPTLAGPFLLAVVAYGLAAGILAVALRPDPLVAAGGLSSDVRRDAPGPSRPLRVAVRDGRAPLALAAMAVTQLVMVSGHDHDARAPRAPRARTVRGRDRHLGPHRRHVPALAGHRDLLRPRRPRADDRCGRRPARVGRHAGRRRAPRLDPVAHERVAAARHRLELRPDRVEHPADRQRRAGRPDARAGRERPPHGHHGRGGRSALGVVLAVGGFAALGVIGPSSQAPLLVVALRVREPPLPVGVGSR